MIPARFTATIAYSIIRDIRHFSKYRKTENTGKRAGRRTQGNWTNRRQDG